MITVLYVLENDTVAHSHRCKTRHLIPDVVRQAQTYIISFDDGTFSASQLAVLMQTLDDNIASKVKRNAK